MARFYSNENFERQAVEELRALGHDVLTSAEAGNANAPFRTTRCWHLRQAPIESC